VQPDPEVPPFKVDHSTGGATPPSPAPEPPTPGYEPPPLVADFPSPLPAHAKSRPALGHLFAMVLSLFLGLFLADAVVALLDDSLVLFCDVHVLTGIRSVLLPFALLMALVVYGLMGLTPIVPKRLFVPLALFSPLAGLVSIPFMIFFWSRMQQVAWVISLSQVILGLGILHKVQGRIKLRWPIVAECELDARGFSWRNLGVFLLANVFVLVPVVALYLCVCASLAVDHFSDGFVALHPKGLTVQVRKYIRNDGKMIQLVPMSHIGEPKFYRKLTQSFPTNALILMEGVSDDRNLLTNKLSYKRMAASLGVGEQQQEFKPSRTQMVRADVDIEQFATHTIDFLNLAMLIHSQGLNVETILRLVQYSEPSSLQEQLFNDIIGKRNRHLLEEIQSRLPDSECIIVPWGAAHMPGIAKGIQNSGFRVFESEEYVAIQFRSIKK